MAVDVSLPHLDRPFDYLISAADADRAVPGVRVRVRFAGTLHDGFVLERLDRSEHATLPIERVVSDEVVLTAPVLALARDIATRQAGTLADLLRLAVPPRHGAAERAAPPAVVPPAVTAPDAGPWGRYGHGEQFLANLATARPTRAVLAALPGDPLPAAVVAAATVAAAGRGAILVVADHRDIAAAAPMLDAVLPPGAWTALTADLGPAERYRRFLAIARGSVRVVVGTRAAGFAPVADLGLVAIVDDGDDLHAEPRAPYPHMREVLGRRSHLEQTGFLIAGHAVTAEAVRLVASGWARLVRADREVARQAAPRVSTAGESTDADPLARAARLPQAAWRIARDALKTGPVLVQVPRGGYVPSLSCARCGAVANCESCGGALRLTGHDTVPECVRCGRIAAGHRCGDCGDSSLRATAVGSGRTAEELGRAFPGSVVRHSAAGSMIATVGPQPALVIATPGAEPIAEGGYAAALLLDAERLLTRPDLRAGEEARRRWFNAAALVRPATAGGRVVVMADPAAVQPLIRWDAFGAADRELADRASAGMPPAVRAAVISGGDASVQRAIAELPPSARILGPTGEPETRRAVVTVDWADSAVLAAGLHAAAAIVSARKEPALTVMLDPVAL